jgi:hypothetical protein
MEIPHLSRGPQAVGYLPFLQLPDMLRIQAPTLVLSRSNLSRWVLPPRDLRDNRVGSLGTP